MAVCAVPVCPVHNNRLLARILTYFDEELTAAAEALWPGLRPPGKAEGGEGDQVLVLILPKHRAPDNIDNQI